MKNLKNKETLFSVGSVCLAALVAAAAFMPYDPPAMKPRAESSAATLEGVEDAVTDTTATTEQTRTTAGIDPAVTDTTPLSQETTETTTTTETIDQTIFRGPWYDSRGNIVWLTEGTKRIAAEGYDHAFANMISAVSGPKLDSVYEAKLRQENPTLLTSSTGNKIGQGVQLTLNAHKQVACYELLESYGINGAIVVMAEDGAIEVAASYPSFSHNEEETQTMDQTGYNHQAFFNYPEGSVAKVRSGVVATYHDILMLEDLGNDTRFAYKNWDYDEHPERYPVTRSLRSALLNSSNYWFGQVFYQLGYQKVSSVLNEYFMFDSEIETDFGTLQQNSDMTSNANLTRTAFGQRSTASMFYTAMSASAVVTGEWNRPYMVSGTVDAVTEEQLSVISTKETLSTIPAAYREEVVAGMQDIAEDLALHAEGYTLAAKTGTAELNTANYDYFLRTAVVMQNDETGETVTALLMIQNPGDFDWAYASESKHVVQEMVDLLVE